jgi:ABC-type Fe2+-enterobactin transport system substrate-binding protein
MLRRISLLALAPGLLHVCVAGAQAPDHPIMDMIANKVIQKYEQAPWQQLAAQKRQKPTGEKAEMEQRAVQALRNNPQMRAEFLNRVAGPIANKPFECGMIP